MEKKNSNQHPLPGRKRKGRRIKLHYQLKLLSWQWKYQAVPYFPPAPPIRALKLIHNTYHRLSARKYPKIDSVTYNLQHRFECAAKTAPDGRQFEKEYLPVMKFEKCGVLGHL